MAGWAWCCACPPAHLTAEKRDANSGFAQLWTADHGAALARCSQDGSGNLYAVGTSSGGVIGRAIDSSGAFTANFSASVAGRAVSVNSGNVWIGYFDTGHNESIRYDTSGTVQATASHAAGLDELVADGSGNVYVAIGPSGSSDGYVEKYDSSGTFGFTRTISGTSNASVAMDGAGDIIGAVATVIGQIRKFDSSNVSIWSQGTSIGPIYDLAVDSADNIWVVYGGSRIEKRSGSTGAVAVANFFVAGAIRACCDSSGNVFVLCSNSGISTVKKYNSSGSLQWTGTLALLFANDIDTDGTYIWAVGDRT